MTGPNCGPDGLRALEPKALALLRLLVENHERVLSRDEMIVTVWGGRFISDAAVSTVLKLVRKALGDDGAAQTYIRTVRGLGHRFVAPVRIRSVAELTGVMPAIPEPTPQRNARPTIAVLPFSQTGLTNSFATLGDGLLAEIISSLARLRWLRVIARESSFRFGRRILTLPDWPLFWGPGSDCLAGLSSLGQDCMSASIWPIPAAVA